MKVTDYLLILKEQRVISSCEADQRFVKVAVITSRETVISALRNKAADLVADYLLNGTPLNIYCSNVN